MYQHSQKNITKTLFPGNKQISYTVTFSPLHTSKNKKLPGATSMHCKHSKTQTLNQ